MIKPTVRMYTAKSSFLIYWGKSSQQYGAFLIPRRNNSGFGKLDRRIYRRHREIRFCPAETSKIAPKAYSRKWPWLFPCFSKNTKGKEVSAIPRMPKYLKREWAFFLDACGRKKYNELCRKCERDCKQSFRAAIIRCPYYLSKRRQV